MLFLKVFTWKLSFIVPCSCIYHWCHFQKTLNLLISTMLKSVWSKVWSAAQLPEWAEFAFWFEKLFDVGEFSGFFVFLFLQSKSKHSIKYPSEKNELIKNATSWTSAIVSQFDWQSLCLKFARESRQECTIVIFAGKFHFWAKKNSTAIFLVVSGGQVKNLAEKVMRGNIILRQSGVIWLAAEKKSGSLE